MYGFVLIFITLYSSIARVFHVMCGGQQVTSQSCFSPSTMGIVGIALRSPGLLAKCLSPMGWVAAWLFYFKTKNQVVLMMLSISK